MNATRTRAVLKLTGRDDVRRDALARLVASSLAEGKPLPDDLEAAILAAAEQRCVEVAHHEAGHAVGARLAGVKIKRISIVPSRSKDELGVVEVGAYPRHRCDAGGCTWGNARWHVQGHPGCAADLRRLVESRVLVSLLAIASEEPVVMPEWRGALHVTSFADPNEDVSTALDVLSMLEPDELLRWWSLHELMLRARALVREPHVKAAIELIVNVLLNEEPDLRGKRLDALVAQVNEVLKQS